jgi:hypothetical protein
MSDRGRMRAWTPLDTTKSGGNVLGHNKLVGSGEIIITFRHYKSGGNGWTESEFGSAA